MWADGGWGPRAKCPARGLLLAASHHLVLLHDSQSGTGQVENNLYLPSSTGPATPVLVKPRRWAGHDQREGASRDGESKQWLRFLPRTQQSLARCKLEPKVRAEYRVIDLNIQQNITGHYSAVEPELLHPQQDPGLRVYHVDSLAPPLRG